MEDTAQMCRNNRFPKIAEFNPLYKVRLENHRPHKTEVGFFSLGLFESDQISLERVRSQENLEAANPYWVELYITDSPVR